MTLTYEQAREIVSKELYSIYQGTVKIFDEYSIELESGWVFFYDSADGGRLTGNAPYILNKFTGELHETGTADLIEYYIDQYEEKINGYLNIWTIRLAKKPGISKYIKLIQLNKKTKYFAHEIWEMLNSYPNIFMEGKVYKILYLKHHFEDIGIEVIMEKKEHSS